MFRVVGCGQREEGVAIDMRTWSEMRVWSKKCGCGQVVKAWSEREGVVVETRGVVWYGGDGKDEGVSRAFRAW